ncbi:MAG: hypothetical protein HFG20_06075 [Anaerotruncus sp.]|nr:hypothetical protein [Anaerotruncus sp.]
MYKERLFKFAAIQAHKASLDRFVLIVPENKKFIIEKSEPLCRCKQQAIIS